MKKYVSEVEDRLDTVTTFGFGLAFVIWAVGSLTFGLAYNQIPPIVPIFYSLVVGESQLAGKDFLMLLPGLSVGFIIFHILLVYLNFSDDRMFSRILALSSTLVSLLYTIALVKIVTIVT